MIEFELNKDDRVMLYEGEERQGFEQVDTYTLSMDSHGCLCEAVIIKHQILNGLYCFIVRSTSEEIFYDDEEVFQVKPYEVLMTKYKPMTKDEQWPL